MNTDFSKRVIVDSDTLTWTPSPMAGVDRRMLDRLGDEVARATSIVRYAPGSHFSPHIHTGGEEFVVLGGVFQDEHGDFPAGSYIRNPPTTRHTPGSQDGCVIFVKLWQFDLKDRTPVKIDMNKIGQVDDAGRDGISVTPLFQDTRETVQLERWAPGTDHVYEWPDGGELLVLEGALVASDGTALAQHSWLRGPMGDRVALKAGPTGAKIWLKTGHLRFVAPPPTPS